MYELIYNYFKEFFANMDLSAWFMERADAIINYFSLAICAVIFVGLIACVIACFKAVFKW